MRSVNHISGWWEHLQESPTFTVFQRYEPLWFRIDFPWFSLPAIESINRVCFNLRDWSHLTTRAMLVRTKRISISPDVKGRTTGSWLAAGNGLEMGMTSQMPCQDTGVEGKTYLFHYPFIFILFSFYFRTSSENSLIIKLDSNLIWGWVKTLVPSEPQVIAGKWMFIPLKMVLIGIDPSPYCASISAKQTIQTVGPSQAEFTVDLDLTGAPGLGLEAGMGGSGVTW